MDKTTTGVSLALGTALISGVSIFLNSYAVKGFDSSVFTFAKNALVAILLAAILLAFAKRQEIAKLKKKEWLQLAGIGLVGGSIPFLLFFKGLQLTTGTTGSFIHKTLFVWVTILAVFALREKIKPVLLGGVALLLAANYLVLRPAFSFAAGHGLILVAVLLWSAENVWAKHLTKKMSGNVIAFGRMAFGSAFILAYLFVVGKASTVVSMSASQYAWIALTGALLFGYVITYYNSLRYIDVSAAASLLVLGSPVTTMLSWIVKGTTLTLVDALGMILMVAGAVAVIVSAYLSAKTAQRVATRASSK